MKVKVTWINNNPFVYNQQDMKRCSETEIHENMDYKNIEEFAKEAAPLGFHLKSIDVAGKVYQYDYNGNKVQ